MAEANFDLGVTIEDFESKFGFLFGEEKDIQNKTVFDHGDDFDLEKFLEGESGIDTNNSEKCLEYVVLSDDSDHDLGIHKQTTLVPDELPDLDM